MLRRAWPRSVFATLVIAFACVPSAAAAPPPNDNFSDAQPIAGEAGLVGGTNMEATWETGEPDHAGEPGTGSVWYRWTPSTDVPIRFDTCDTPAFDSLLAVYTGSDVGVLTPVRANDDGCGVGSAVDFTARAGTTYSIAVDGFDAQGNFDFRWSLAPPTNVTPPSIDGDVVENARVTARSGHWHYATSFSYSWHLCPASETTVTIRCTRLNRTASLLTVPLNSVGQKLGLSVSATGPGGPSLVVSTLSDPVRYAAPANTSQPKISGTAEVGGTLVSSEGTWNLGSAPRLDLKYQWERCDVGGSNCQVVKGPGYENSYLLGVADRGFALRSVITMTSAGGTLAAASAVTEIITSPQRVTPRQRCVVPRLTGRTLRWARAALSRSRCRLGTVRRVFSARRVGRVVLQRPAVGRRLPVGTRVNVVLSKGRRR